MLAKVFIDKGYFDYIVLDCYIEGVGWLGTAVFANPGGEQDFELDTESVYGKPSPFLLENEPTWKNESTCWRFLFD